MKSTALRLIVYCLLLSFGVYVGVGLAHKGMERISGPLSSVEKAAESARGITTPAAAASPSRTIAPTQEKAAAKAPPIDKSLISKWTAATVAVEPPAMGIGNRMGKVLQATARSIMQFIVALFDFFI